MGTALVKRSNTLPAVVGKEMTLLERLKSLYQKSDRVINLLVGMRSYDKYVEHMKTKHPEQSILSRADFFKEALEARYNGGVSRCC